MILLQYSYWSVPADSFCCSIPTNNFLLIHSLQYACSSILADSFNLSTPTHHQCLLTKSVKSTPTHISLLTHSVTVLLLINTRRLINSCWLNLLQCSHLPVLANSSCSVQYHKLSFLIWSWRTNCQYLLTHSLIQNSYVLIISPDSVSWQYHSPYHSLLTNCLVYKTADKSGWFIFLKNTPIRELLAESLWQI